MSKDILRSKIMFGDGVYARQMRLGMQDIVDIKGLHDNSKLYEGSTGDFAAPFDTLMGIKTYHPDTKTFTEGPFTFDVVPDMRKRCFAIQDTKLEGYAYTARFGCFNYFKCEIAYSDGSYTRFYGFVTNQTYLNSANAVLFEYAIDWAHTAQLYRGGAASYYQPFDLKQAYVARDNKHHINLFTSFSTNEAKETVNVFNITVGKGAENIKLFELKELELKTPYHPADCGMLPDDQMRYVKIVLSKPETSVTYSEKTINIKAVYTGYNGLYTLFMPLYKPSDGRSLVVYYEGTFSGNNVGFQGEELSFVFGFLNELSMNPNVVSIELINEIPCIEKVERGEVSGIAGTDAPAVKILLNTGNRPTIVRVNGSLYGLPPLIDIDAFNGSISRSTFKPSMSETNLDIFNAPRDTSIFARTVRNSDGVTLDVGAYSHVKHRAYNSIEPKLSQPQFTDVEITDNMGASFNVDLTQTNANKYALTVVSDYNGTNNKRKFYIDGYAGDNGKHYCAVAQKVSAFPLINDALIDYLNANKNQMTTGLALAKRNFIASEVGALVGGVGGMVGGYMSGKPLATVGAAVGAIGGAVKAGLNYDATLQQHEAQIADLQEQARSVESVAGNNAEFDIADENGTIMRYKWIPSSRDRNRLVEYFHRHGYAVGEIQQDISTDTMYYFDYIQCSDIVFGQDVNDELSNSGQFIMFRECDEYIRDMFAKGVRIWHGRCPDQDKLKPQIFVTPYINTAKEY